MPWQRHAADIGLEYEVGAGGVIIPAYREVIVTVMRQSGKSTLVFSLVAHRCTVWPRLPQRAVYTAQDGAAARAKVMADAVPMFEASPVVSRLIQRVYRGVGPLEGVNWRTGSTLRMVGSTEQSGHGITDLGLAVIDESFADYDFRREQALSPAMATVPDAQIWNVSTAGTDASVFLRRKIEMGRAAAEAGDTSGVAYIEYSIPDDADVDSESTWWEFMPALGWTITPNVVAHARRTMSDNDWRRSFGNQWTSADERAIPVQVWESACGPSVRPSGPLTWCVEVHPDRSSACVVCAGDSALELVDKRPGVGWVAARVAGLVAEHGGIVRVDGGGPAAAVLDDLVGQGVTPVLLSGRDVVSACGALYDGLADGRLRVRSDDRLDLAVGAVTRRFVGESWAWSRRSPVADVYPVMALSLAALPVPAAAAPFFVY